MNRSTRLFYLLFTVILFNNGCATNKHATKVPTTGQASAPTVKTTDFSEQSTWLLGYFNPVQLSRPPYSEWYLRGYGDYQPEESVVESLAAITKDELSIQIVLGTWCPDSRREVPRFMKILDLWKFPGEQVTFIGVDNAKLSPVGDFDKMDIQRVPTFIILKNKIEKGRIIENPVTSLEQDLLDILTRNE